MHMYIKKSLKSYTLILKRKRMSLFHRWFRETIQKFSAVCQVKITPMLLFFGVFFLHFLPLPWCSIGWRGRRGNFSFLSFSVHRWSSETRISCSRSRLFKPDSVKRWGWLGMGGTGLFWFFSFIWLLRRRYIYEDDSNVNATLRWQIEELWEGSGCGGVFKMVVHRTCFTCQPWPVFFTGEVELYTEGTWGGPFCVFLCQEK